MTIKIDYEKCCWQEGACKSCGCGGACEGCVEICPTGALTREDKLSVDIDKCTDCGLCINSCKHDALSFEVTITL
ncbi:4Fe-4S binding protein [Candidatus Woesearchaeota archaeon]|nr:4Fe-4S binding protein [Candidatus Woesearchaeota archaeon]